MMNHNVLVYVSRLLYTDDNHVESEETLLNRQAFLQTTNNCKIYF
jgi:hypothetical protein